MARRSGSSRAASTTSRRSRGTAGYRFRRLRSRWPRRRRTRGRAPAVLDALLPQMPDDARYLRASVRPSTSPRLSLAASTCSTASSPRHAQRAAVHVARDRQVPPCPLRRRYVRAGPGAAATPAATTASPTWAPRKCGEILGPRLATIHNLNYYQKLMNDLREAIRAGETARFVGRLQSAYA